MKYLCLEMYQPLKYMLSGNLISKEGFLHIKRTLNCYVLILVKEGTLPISIGNQKFLVEAGNFTILPANLEHFGYQEATGRVSYYWMHFFTKGELISTEKEIQEYEKSEDRMLIPITGECGKNRKAEILFSQLLDLAKQPQAEKFGMLNYACSLVLIQLARDSFQKRNAGHDSFQKIMRIEEWIRDNYNEPLTVQSIAKEFAYNPDYLSLFYKQATGRTLTSFIHKVKIDISKSYLVHYEISVKEAAYSSGFSDEKQYMKLFKKYENMTPTEYKKTFFQKNFNNK